jgi:hypothetical protein
MIINSINHYDGRLLHQRFAFSFLGDGVNPLGDIIVFRGAMQVEADNMIDQEDVQNQDFIYADDAVNFLWEIPNLEPFGAVAFQRLFNHEIAVLLAKTLLTPIEIQGDDIYIEKRKASVSITHVKNHAALGHTAINIIAGNKAPDFAYSTHLTNEQAQQFMYQVNELFYAMIKTIFIATTKVLVK